MSVGFTEIPPSESPAESLRQSRRDRWASPLAFSTTASHFLAGLFTLGWYYWIVPRVKYSLDQAGAQVPTDVIFVISLSDLFVNYWYLLGFVGPVILLVDFLVTRWIARALGLRAAIGFGATIMLLILANMVYPYYVLSKQM